MSLVTRHPCKLPIRQRGRSRASRRDASVPAASTDDSKVKAIAAQSWGLRFLRRHSPAKPHRRTLSRHEYRWRGIVRFRRLVQHAPATARTLAPPPVVSPDPAPPHPLTPRDPEAPRFDTPAVALAR